MEIRPATVADAPAVARVHVETWRAAYAGIVDGRVLDALSVPQGTAQWESRLADPHAVTYVAVLGGDVCGFGCGGGARDAGLRARTAEVYAMYVLPSAQRRGAGAALLDAVTTRMLHGGCDTVVLWVLAANAAGRAFYEANGWSWDGTERRLDVGGALVDEVRYTRSPELR